MNEKELVLYKILDIVVEECTSSINDDVKVTKDDVIGKCKRENVIMTRCIYVAQLKCLGYSHSTIAAILNRQTKAVPEILSTAYEYKKKSRCWRMADARCTLRINQMFPEQQEE